MADNTKYIQAQDFKLAGSGITATDTTIVVQSFAGIDGVLLTMADFGDEGWLTIAPDTSSEEQIQIIGVTQNANGTATLDCGATGRGRKFIAPYDQDLTLRKAHAGNTIIRITNTAGFYSQFPAVDNDETVTGKWTFPVGGDVNAPVSGTLYSAPTDLLEYTSKQYVDSEISAVVVGAIPAFVVQQNGADPSLLIDISSGEYMVGNEPNLFAGVSGVAVTAVSTNYVQLDASGSVVINLSAFLTDHLPLAIVTTDATDITSIVDRRSWLTLASDDQGITRQYTYGATISVGDLLRLDTADSKWKLSDADGVAAEGTLTLGGATVLDTETVTIGSQTYTFNTVLGGANSILIGGSNTAAMSNLLNAIIGGPGSGSVYGVGTSVNTSVTATSSSPTVTILTALVNGVDGNAIKTTDTFSDGANTFDGATLGTTTAGINANTYADDVFGVALDAGVDTDTNKRVQVTGVVASVSGLGTAGTQYVSDTPGEVSNTAGTYSKVIGFSPDGSTMVMNNVAKYDDIAGFTEYDIRYGGDGSDGQLAITAGTTTLDLGGEKVKMFQYTNIEIGGTGDLAFSNPHDEGSIVIIRSQGFVKITTTANPAIDLRNLGSIGGAGGATTADNGDPGTDGDESKHIIDGSIHYGGAGGSGLSTIAIDPISGGTGGTGGVAWSIMWKGFLVGPGAGGGGGGAGGKGTNNNPGAGGDGGRGAGALIMEIGSNLSGSGNINASGTVGGAGSDTTASSFNHSNSGGGGGGAGGGAGTVLLEYQNNNTYSGTISVFGGGGGAKGNLIAGLNGGVTSECGAGGGGGGGGASIVNDGTVGNVGLGSGSTGSCSAGDGGAGSAGGSGIFNIYKRELID